VIRPLGAFGDNYRERKIELLAFSLPAGGCVGVAVKCGNYLAKLAYYNFFPLLLENE